MWPLRLLGQSLRAEWAHLDRWPPLRQAQRDGLHERGNTVRREVSGCLALGRGGIHVLGCWHDYKHCYGVTFS